MILRFAHTTLVVGIFLSCFSIVLPADFDIFATFKSPNYGHFVVFTENCRDFMQVVILNISNVVVQFINFLI